MTSGEFIMVPVPKNRVQEVYKLLAGPPSDGPSAAPPPTDGDWTDEMIMRAYKESPATMKRFLRHLANAAGKTFTSEALGTAVGYSSRQQAGMLGAFGNRVKQRYGQATWFFAADRDPETGTFVYRMDPRAAKIVKRSGE